MMMTTIMLPITLTTAAAAALLNVWLAMRVGQVRGQHKVSIGDGGNDAVIARMRAHANFVEYTPIVLILFALIELAHGSAMWLWVVAVVYLIGRVLHALGMDGLKSGRAIGTATTLLIMAGLAVFAVVLPYLHQTPAALTTEPFRVG